MQQHCFVWFAKLDVNHAVMMHACSFNPSVTRWVHNLPSLPALGPALGLVSGRNLFAVDFRDSMQDVSALRGWCPTGLCSAVHYFMSHAEVVRGAAVERR